ncbi:MAG TPA: ABC transporter ATP-binding protein [Firmicutes bacterium]|jgi:ABC-2 type transport system ATP-binding protein|nr:ABC transporter ATP-binding protein [Bacillota bacterium]
MMVNVETNTVAEIKGLVKRYKGFTLGPIDLQLESGYVYGVIGQNGAGKTTLLKAMMNLVQPTQGTIRVFNMDYAGHEQDIKRQIGYVPEEPFLYQLMKPDWFGRFVAPFYPRWDAQEYDKLLADLQIDRSKTVKQMSRGTKVKLELALALAHHPSLLLLDEPTSGLDPLIRRQILDKLAGVVQDETRTVVFSTHITEDVERIADYIVFIVDGAVALFAERESLRDDWQELILNADDMTGLPGIEKVIETQNSVVRVTCSQASTALRRLRQKGKSPIHARPLSLDDILAALAGRQNSAT